MKYFDFNPFGTKSIIVKFNCDNCSHSVESEEIYVPSPNYMADTARDSQTDNEGYAICENCEKQFDIDIYVTYAGGDGHIKDLPDNHQVTVDEIDEPYYEDQYEAISDNTAFLDTFNIELDNLISLLAIEPEDGHLKRIFHRQLFVSVIGTMETYLSDAFINTVLSSKEKLRLFFETYKGFDKQNVAISAIYDFQDKAESVAKKTMLDVIYHHLPKVSGMYKDTLNVQFPDFGEIYKAVLKRHDLVHRNGKDKEGNEVVVDSEMIKKLTTDVKDFITQIDDQIDK